ncbi:hypothetical protein D3C73_1450440 [compost metagenome]
MMVAHHGAFFLAVHLASVSAGTTQNNLCPHSWIDDLVEPQTFARLVTERLADAHLTYLHSGLMHAVV